jgi:NADH dehydrogenase
LSRVAVTGAAGFVGRHLVPLLAVEGHEVRALVRPGSAAGALGNDLRITRGDVCDPDAMRGFLDGAQTLVHLAASFSPAEIDSIDAGTRAVLQAAKDASVGRIVLLSCLPAHAASQSPFYRAKWRAEQLVRASGLPYVVLRSSLVLGPGDRVVAPLATLVRTYPAIPLPAGGRQRSQPIDVEDLARCITLATTEDGLSNKEVSVAGPMFMTVRQLVDLIAGQLGVSKPKVLVPDRLLAVVGGALPPGVLELFTGPRLGEPIESPATSPGIVQRMFGFEPKSIPAELARYLEPVATLA